MKSTFIEEFNQTLDAGVIDLDKTFEEGFAKSNRIEGAIDSGSQILATNITNPL